VKRRAEVVASSYMSTNAGEGGCWVLDSEYSSAHGARINFGDLTPYFRFKEQEWGGRSKGLGSKEQTE
jgi:hypothetical protein